MNMNNNYLNEDYVVDIEFLRFEKLIEEREAYEEEFYSMAPPEEDLGYFIEEYEPQIETPEVTCSFEGLEAETVTFPVEFLQEMLRDEKLIRKMDEHGSKYDDIILDEFALNDIYDFQIAAREKEEFIEMDSYDYEPEDYGDYEYDQYEEDMFWNLHYLRQSQFEKPKCSCAYMDYMPNDDGFCDYLDCYDYPEGPDENLNGIKFY